MAWIALAAVPATVAQAQSATSSPAAPAPYAFADETALAVSAGDLAEGVEIEVRNATTEPRTLTVRLSGFELKPDSAGKASVDPPTLTLSSASSATATLTVPQPAELEPGSYTGTIVVFEDGGPVTRRGVTITAPGGTAATPAVAKFAMRAEWVVGSKDWERWSRLPLKQSAGTDAAKLAIEKDAVLGRLSGPNGDTAAVRWTGDSTRIQTGEALALDLDIDGLGRAGEYSGTIDLVPGDDEAGDVEVTATYAHAVWWAILALLAGIGAALLLKRLADVKLEVWRLEAKLADIGARFPAVQRSFLAMTDRTPAARYDILEAVDTQIAAVREMLANLGGFGRLSLSADDKKAAGNAIKQLDGDIASWAPAGGLPADDDKSTFAEDLVDVAERIETIKRRALEGGAPPGYKSDHPGMPRPEVVHALRPRLEGRKLPTLAEYRDCRKELQADAAFTTTWIDLDDEMARASRIAGLLSGIDLGEKDAEELEHAERGLAAARLEMWRAEKTDDLITGKTEDDLRSAAQALDRLSVLLPSPTAQEQADRLTMLNAVGGFGGIVEVLGHPIRTVTRHRETTSPQPVDHEARATQLRRLIARSTTVLVWIAAAIAVFTGLVALYFGNAWGTPIDYVKAAMWGLTTEAAIVALVAAVARAPAADTTAA